MTRPVMATTILVGLAARAWGFPGKLIRMNELEGSLRLWRFKLQSHEAETRISRYVLAGTSAPRDV